MPPPPFPPGEPICPRDGDSRWFEPVNVAPDYAQETGAETDSAIFPAPVALRGQAVPWRGIRWVGFGSGPDAPVPAEDRAGRFDAADGDGASGGALSTSAAAGRTPPSPTGLVGAATAGSEAVRATLRRRLGAGIGRLLRLGGAAASVGLVVVFAYEGGERLAGFAGAMTPPSGGAGRQVAVLDAAVLDDAAPKGAVPNGPVPNGPVPEDVVPEDVVRRGARAPDLPPSQPPERVIPYLDRAQAGDPVAQYNIAVLYARGEDGLDQDYRSAASWFREAAANGNLAAQFNLGVIHERGFGVEADMEQAVAWYRRAAERNYAAAEYNLALAYAEGRGTVRDPVAAAGWYQRAAGQGLIPAMVNLAILSEVGEGIERSPTDAYAWYRAAARRGDPAAAQRAGDLFQRFTGPEKEKAVIAAAVVAGTLSEPTAKPARVLPKTAKSGADGAMLKPDGSTGRAGVN